MAKDWLIDEEERERVVRAGKWSPVEVIAVVLTAIASIGLLANLFFN